MTRYAIVSVLSLATFATSVQGDVPERVNHQGVVFANGERFAGTAGYFKFSFVKNPGPTEALLWSNDDNTDPVASPVAFVPLSIANGVYSVTLGAPPMLPIPSRVFEGPTTVLRIWFDSDGVGTGELLSPDQVISTVPFAHRTQFAEGANRLNIPGSQVPAAFVEMGSGFVGINTTDPNSRLHISGHPSAGAQLRIDDSVARGYAIGVDGDFYIQDVTANEAPVRLKIDGSGRVGIGGNPVGIEKLQVFGHLNASGNITCSGFVSGNNGCCPSDKRFKRDIHTFNGALDKLLAIRGVNFQWKTLEFPDRGFPPSPQIGFIAQELAGVVPEVVISMPDETLAVDYGRLSPLLVEGIKELSTMVGAQREQIAIQALRIDELEQRLRRLETSESRLLVRDGSTAPIGASADSP